MLLAIFGVKKSPENSFLDTKLLYVIIQKEYQRLEMPVAKVEPEERAIKFIHTRSIVTLATKNKRGKVWGSCTPFVYHNGNFYVGVNYIAEHTKNMLESAGVCALFRADEGGSKNLYALERFTVRCRAVSVENDSLEWLEVIPLFEQKFGKQFDLARQLKDFFLIRLQPTEAGRYVRGFGLAYDVPPDFSGSTHVQGAHIDRGGSTDKDPKK